MSSRCLVTYKEYEFYGNISQECISFGDIDHDGHNELVIGTIEGQVLAYRPVEAKPFATLSNMGVITVTLIGDFLHAHVNSILCITHVGTVFVGALRAVVQAKFAASIASEQPENRKNIEPAALSNVDVTRPELRDYSAAANAAAGDELMLLHSQRMPPNTKYVVAHDFDSDGFPEILLGMTDRTVRLYKWKERQSPGSQHGVICGSFVGIYKWEFASQIGSISLLDQPPAVTSHEAGNERAGMNTVRVLVSQAGGRYAHIDSSVTTNEKGMRRVHFADPVQHELASLRMRSSNEYTWIVGNVRSYAKPKPGTPPDDEITNELSNNIDFPAKKVLKNLCALCTSHGNIMVVDGNNILLDFQAERKLHFIQKFDITGDGDDEIIVFADRADVLLGGLAYIIDSQFRVAKVWLPETPKVIYAGYIGIPNRQDNSPNSFCFACFTINNRLMVFYDIPKPNFSPRSMLAHFKDIFVDNGEGGISEEQYKLLSTADKRKILRELVQTKSRKVFNDIW